MAVRMDDMDRKILAELQADAEQSLDEIARKVGSSKTPVWNRIRRMKEAGVITRQTAILDPEALGLEADDPQRLSDWLVAAGIHWGVDGLTAVDTDTGDAGGVEGPVGPDGSLVPLGPDGADEHPLHAWRSGLDRLLEVVKP